MGARILFTASLAAISRLLVQYARCSRYLNRFDCTIATSFNRAAATSATCNIRVGAIMDNPENKPMNRGSAAPTVTLTNDALTCEIALRGAELRSLRDVASKDEFIWQRNPTFLSASAPILFPVIGCFNNGGYLLNGRFHEIPKHGFARNMNFLLVASNEASATFQLTDTDSTFVAYPYAFALEVMFTLHERTLAVDYRLVNRSDRMMFFALGSHPAFNLPVKLGPLEDWSIQFETVEKPICHRFAENQLSSVPEPYEFEAGNRIVLTGETFVRDALIFKGIRSHYLQIVHREHGVRLRFNTGGAPTLGIWAKPGAPYVCLEPWYGFDDSSEINADMRQKPDMLSLAAGESFATGYSITV